MARYEYQCTDCNARFTVELSMADKLKGAGDNVRCPHCNAPSKQIFSASGVVFKGSGFFNTDRRAHMGTCGDDALIEGAGKKKSDSSASPCPAAGSASACSGCAHASE